MYRYLGNERLQFAFFSPNVCAAFLVVTAVLTVGLFLLAVKRRGLRSKVVAGVFGGVALLQFMMIAVTYSRGGYVACFMALTAAAACCRKRWSWVFPALFLVVLFLTGDGASRVQSMGDVGDGSIRNRLLLWHYGTGVVARHWAAGIAEPGVVYTRYYQPLWLDEGYYSLINDFLTLAAMYGIFVLFATLTLLFFLFQYGFRLWLATRNELLLYALAALAGYVVAGCFTTCFRFPGIQILLAMLSLLIFGFLVWGLVKRKFRRNKFDFWPAPALAGAICGGLLVYGGIVNATLPYSRDSVPFETREVEILIPRKTEKAALFVLIPPRGEEYRTILRPLVEQGFRVIALPIENGFGEFPLAGRMFSQFRRGGNTFLIGIGEERAMQAIALAGAEGISGVIAVEPPLDWPFEELSPQVRLPKLKIPVRIYLTGQRTEDAEKFRALIDRSGVAGDVVLLSEAELRNLTINVPETEKP